jgi:antitoxin MazE
MKVQVGRWGNSLAVRLPKALTDMFGIREGDEIDASGIEASLREAARTAKQERRRSALDEIGQVEWSLPPGWKLDRSDPDMRG